jgi:hypothetical protein
MAFNPNETTLKEGLERVRQVQTELGLDTSKIFTSKDAGDLYNNPKTLVTNIPNGFTKIMLPISTTKEATFYISAGAPNTHVPRHSHNEGEGIRFIVAGSILYKAQELSEADWMYVPANASYEFKVGPRGVVMCYCYCCSCAPRIQ